MIKKLFIFFLLIPTKLFGGEYNYIDSLVGLKSKNIKTVDEFVIFIKNSNIKTEKDKVRAIVIFITNKLMYGKKYVKNINSYNVDSLLYYGQTVCSGYSFLFKSISEKLCIKSEIVQGITNNHYSYFLKTSKLEYLHNWNLVYVDGNACLIDVTWCDINSEKIDEIWFISTPTFFLKTHYPCGDALNIISYNMLLRFKYIYNCNYLKIVNYSNEFNIECEKYYKYQLVDKPITFKDFILK